MTACTAHDRSPHERYTNVFASRIRPTYSLPDRVSLRPFFRRRRRFRERPLCHEEMESSVTSFTDTLRASRLGARDAHLSVRFFVQPGPIFQSPSGINDRKDGANNTPGWMCIRDGMREREALVIVAERNTPQYIAGQTSRERDVDVSNLLVLIKKSHKVSARP